VTPTAYIFLWRSSGDPPQPSAPTPGPTAAVSLSTSTGGDIGFAARITPFPTGA
jgi:hypothetical protein